MLDMAQTRQDWFSEVLPVNVTGAMSEAAVEQQRLEYTGIFSKEAADALIDQEYYCSFEAASLPHQAPTERAENTGTRKRRYPDEAPALDSLENTIDVERTYNKRGTCEQWIKEGWGAIE